MAGGNLLSVHVFHILDSIFAEEEIPVCLRVLRILLNDPVKGCHGFTELIFLTQFCRLVEFVRVYGRKPHDRMAVRAHGRSVPQRLQFACPASLASVLNHDSLLPLIAVISSAVFSVSSPDHTDSDNRMCVSFRFMQRKKFHQGRFHPRAETAG